MKRKALLLCLLTVTAAGASGPGLEADGGPASYAPIYTPPESNQATAEAATQVAPAEGQFRTVTRTYRTVAARTPCRADYRRSTPFMGRGPARRGFSAIADNVRARRSARLERRLSRVRGC